MKSREKKLEELRERAISKIRWGERPEQVHDWLLEQPASDESSADQLLEEALRQRRLAIRNKGITHLVLGIAGLLLVGAFFYVRFFNGVIFYGVFAILATAAAAIIGVLCLRTIVRSLSWLITGTTAGSVD